MSPLPAHRWYDAVIDQREPMQPRPTDVRPELKRIEGIRAVIFDIYGTLVVSGSGDVGSADSDDRGDAISDALSAAGINPQCEITIDDLHQQIRLSNASRQSAVCPKPEVDIVDCWRKTLVARGVARPTTQQLHVLAAQYESRANPTWPMPGSREVLAKLHQSGFQMGIVSNAQGFTLRLVEEIAGRFGVDSVFDSNLCVFSRRYRQAKPGPRLFNVLCGGLQRCGIQASEAIYVGNDRLNDIWAASQAGLKTAWFAGDQRSLRRRDDDKRTDGLKENLILTQLEQLPACLSGDTRADYGD